MSVYVQVSYSDFILTYFSCFPRGKSLEMPIFIPLCSRPSQVCVPESFSFLHLSLLPPPRQVEDEFLKEGMNTPDLL